MKRNLSTLVPVALTVLIALFFGMILTIFVRLMEDISLDLSLMLADGEEPEDFDDHGWSVFTQNGNAFTPLTGDGLGSYTGIEPGETLYFSRVMSESLNSPTMHLGSVNRNFAVLLDGELVYTDCPQLDNRIGFLKLPMKEWDELEPLTISRPADYQGKTLTIAKSTPEYSETSVYRVYPASVRLYCGYSRQQDFFFCLPLPVAVQKGFPELLLHGLYHIAKGIDPVSQAGHLVAGGNEDDHRPVALLPQRTGQRHAVEPVHHHIEKEQVVFFAASDICQERRAIGIASNAVGDPGFPEDTPGHFSDPDAIGFRIVCERNFQFIICGHDPDLLSGKIVLLIKFYIPFHHKSPPFRPKGAALFRRKKSPDFSPRKARGFSCFPRFSSFSASVVCISR